MKWVGLIGFLFIIYSCEKDSQPIGLAGSMWVSTDKKDTLKFVDDHLFKKSGHSFAYNMSLDSITIQYTGPYYILVNPTNHNYFLINNILTIDFTNGCYGFDSEIITFRRKGM